MPPPRPPQIALPGPPPPQTDSPDPPHRPSLNPPSNPPPPGAFGPLLLGGGESRTKTRRWPPRDKSITPLVSPKDVH